MKLWEWSRQAEGRVFEGCFLCDGVNPLYRFTLSQPDWQWEAELNTDEKKDNQKRCVCLTITPSTPSVPLPMELSPGMMGGTRGEPGAVLHQPGEPADLLPCGHVATVPGGQHGPSGLRTAAT